MLSRRCGSICLVLAACSGGSAEADGEARGARADAGSPATSVTPPPTALRPPAKVAPSNPLGLPARKLALQAGQLVFAVPERMLEGAKEGSSLTLVVAKVTALEGDELVVAASDGATYRIHPGYVIPVPPKRQVRAKQAVVAEYAGALRHGVVVRMDKERPRVRFVDVGERAPELSLRETAAVFAASEGLSPGNYAALGGQVDGPLHVLLVSPLVRGDRRMWLTFGFAGVTRLVDEALLVPIPLSFTPKNGQIVLAATSIGRLRKGSVEGRAEDGLFWVKFERAGKSETVGIGGLLRIEALPLLEAVKGPADAPKPPEADEPKAKTFL